MADLNPSCDLSEIFDLRPETIYSSQSKKMDPPGPKQTNEVHNLYVRNRT
jgi:hypothetical protein